MRVLLVGALNGVRWPADRRRNGRTFHVVRQATENLPDLR